MADEQPRPPQRAWRDAITSAASGGKGGPAWKGAVDASKGVKQPWSKKTRLAVAAGLFGVVVGAIVLVILWLRPPKPFRLVVLSAGYETNLAIPHNVPGRTAATRLAAWGKDNAGFIEVKEGPLTSDLGSLDEGLERCKAKTVVLFLAAHGSADSEGVYLVPQNADLKDRARSRVRLGQILDRLARLPDDSKKLLILDATLVTASWPLGLFHNDFARELKGLEKRIKEIPGLVVLAASDEDQRSWASEEWRQSIFAHHVLEGLRGAADDGTNRITAHGLHRYVADKVKHWARHNRGSLQTPILLGGDERARAMELVAVETTYHPPDPLKAAPPPLPPDLQTAWAERDKLAAQTPPPAVCTPQLWRLYEETLLRYEQLLRADDRLSADKVRADLAPLRQKIATAGERKLDSALGTLAMPTALGWHAPPLDEAKTAELKALLEKGKQQAALKEKVAEWLGTEKEPWKKQLLRVRLAGLLLRLAAEDPSRHLAPIRELLTAPEDVSAVRPAEAHYLVLLARDLAPEPPWNAVKDALLLRRTAEEAALGLADGEAEGGRPVPCSETVLPWIRPELHKADRERRLGQDLLLASAEKDRQEATERLGKARAHYKAVQETALRVRRALLLRDRVLAELPYYSQWLAGGRFIGEGQMAKLLTLPVDAQVALWNDVNELDRLLQDPTVGAGAALDKFTDAVAKGFAGVAEEFRTRAGQNHGIRQENWHEIDGLLMVPFLRAKERMDLLGKLRQISERLNQEGEKAGGAEGMTPDETRLLAREGARAQGRLALSVLGKKAFDAMTGQDDYDKTRAAIWSSPNGTWQVNLALAGDEVARRWNRIPGEADRSVVLSRSQPIAKAGLLVDATAALARRLPGATAAWLATDPLDEQRRLQLHDLLCQQGERTFQDFLAEDAPGQGGPYYRVAGLVYHDDALSQLQPSGAAADKQAPVRLERVAGLKETLTDNRRELAIGCSLDGRKFGPSPANLPLTDEEDVPVWYAVKAVQVPEGYPVLWQEPNDKASFLKPAVETGRRVQRGVAPDPSKGAALYPIVRLPRENAPPTVQRATQRVHGRFRGHKLLGETAISYFGQPTEAAALPALPTMGRLAVQATPEVYRKYGVGNGAVVLILDCSDSMNEPADPNQPNGPKRFDEAKSALKQLLAAIPSGTQVSLWAFSHKVPEPWSVEGIIEQLCPPTKWEPSKRTRLAAQIDALKARSVTPIVRTMMMARKDFKGQNGFKTMVVLTDGMDTCFETQKDPRQGPDSLYNPDGKLKIQDFLAKQFKDSDIAIRIIGFQLSADERPIAERQFKIPLENLPKKGRFYDVRKTNELIEKLTESIKQRLFFTLQEVGGQVVKVAKGGVDVNKMGENSHWLELPPRYYYVALEDTPLRQQIEIRRGDRLRLNLSEGPQGFVLQRDLIERSYPGARPIARRPMKDWLLNVWQNQRLTTEEATRMMVSLEYLREREFVGDKSVLSQVVPGLILFQVRRQDGAKETPTLRFRPLADYAAPAWGLLVRPWSRLDAPVLEAFWSEDPPERAAVLRRGTHFDDTLQVKPETAEVKARLNPLQGEEGTVRLLSLRIEKHLVDTFDGKRRKEVSCFVVRLAYPPGKPVMVQLPGIDGGQEHRFYNQAGKYTGLFWEMTAQEVQDRVASLNVISLEGFRAAAVRSGLHARIELRPPNLDRPPPLQ